MFGEINKKMLPMKVHFFLWNAGVGPITPFLSTYARQLGFSSITVGLIYTILPVCGMLAKPLSGAIADRFRCQKGVFLVATLVTAFAFLCTFHAPPVVDTLQSTDGAISYVNFSCTVNESVAMLLQQRMPSMGNAETNFLNESVECNFECGENITQNSTQHSFNTKLLKIQPQNGTIHLFLEPNKNISTCGTHAIQCKIRCNNQTPGNTQYTSLINGGKSNLSEIEAEKEVYEHYEFWVFLVLMILGWASQAVTVSVGDAICFQMLGDKPNNYGQQRLYGSLGWGVSSCIAGVVVDAMSDDGSAVKNFTFAFYMGVGLLILDVVVCYNLKFEQVNMSANIFKDLLKLLNNIRILVFMVWCIGVGMCTGLLWQFLFWLIEDLAQGTNSWIKTLEGLVMGIETICGEVPFFFLSGWILKHIGHINTMSLVPFVIGVRFILYSVIKNPWFFLPVELLNGLTFGLFYAAMASYASIVAPPGTEATTQGLVGAVFEGVGVSLGSLLGGHLYHIYGGPFTFRLFGIGALILSVFHIVTQYILRDKSEGNSSKEFAVEYASPIEQLCRNEESAKTKL